MANWQYNGQNGSIRSGYAVTHPRRKGGTIVNGSDHDPATRGGNLRLTNQDGDTLHLWVHEIEAGFQMGGAFGQSAYQRTWFARSFTQPKFTIHGQMPNSFQYQRLAEFVRESQLKMLGARNLEADNELIGLTLPSIPVPENGRQRGPHTGYHFRGYIAKIERGAERWVNAPEFTFEFIVAYAYQGIFTTNRAIANSLATWTDVFQNHAVFTKDDDDPVERVDFASPDSSDSTANIDPKSQAEGDFGNVYGDGRT